MPAADHGPGSKRTRPLFTPPERALVELGKHTGLRDTRLFMQYAAVGELGEPVEHISGRTVRSFHSSIDTHLDGQAAETFVFYPDKQDAPSRSKRHSNDEV